MTDYSELKRLAKAAKRNGSEWFEPWDLPLQSAPDAQYIVAANPAALLALIAENERLQQFRTAYTEWSDKTEWVQDTAQAHELGLHRADVMKRRIDQLKAEVEALRKDAGRYRWLRDGAGYCDTRDIPGMAPARMDAFIDAAMENHHE